MGKVRRIIPFSWWPGNWGLSGARRATAEAEYYWEGEALDRKLLDINHPDKDSKEYLLALCKLDRRYNKIGEFDYEYGMIAHNPNVLDTDRNSELAKLRHRFGKISSEELDYELLDIRIPNKESQEYLRDRLALDVKHRKVTDQERDHKLLELRFEDHDSKEFKLAKLDLDKKHGVLSHQMWEKETATINEEPWFDVIGGDVRGKRDGQQLAIEMDWNEFFPRFLEECGWTGYATDDEIVDAWFSQAMRNMVEPDLSPEQIQAMEDDDYLPARNGTRRTPGEGGMTEYS